MKYLSVFFLLLVSIVCRAQQPKLVDMPEFTYHKNDPDRYKWKKVFRIADRALFRNTVVATDSLIFCFGGFNPGEIMANREVDIIDGKRFLKTDIQYPGKGFIDPIFFVRDSLLFMGGGTDSNETNYEWTDFWQYNLNTKAWKRLKDLPFYYRQWQQTFVMNDRIIAMIPELSDSALLTQTLQFYEYEPQGDKWFRIVPANPIPFISIPRAFRIDDTIYVFAEQLKHGPDNQFYKFSLSSRTWSVAPAFPGPPRKLVFAGNDERYGYIGGGAYNSNGVNARDVYRFDAVSNHWERCPDLPVGLRWGNCWHYKGDIYAGFGINDHENTIMVWKLRSRK